MQQRGLRRHGGEGHQGGRVAPGQPAQTWTQMQQLCLHSLHPPLQRRVGAQTRMAALQGCQEPALAGQVSQVLPVQPLPQALQEALALVHLGPRQGGEQCRRRHLCALSLAPRLPGLPLGVQAAHTPRSA
jgi:hypothetical protein